MTQKKFSSQTGLLSFSATIVYFAHILQQAKAQDQLLDSNDRQIVTQEKNAVLVAEGSLDPMNNLDLSLIQDHHIQPVDLSASDLNDDSRTSEKSITTEDDHSGGSTLLFFAGAALVGSTVFINSGSDNNENNTVELTDLQTTPIVERASFIDFVLHDDFVTTPITMSSTDVNQVNLEMLSLSDASAAVITDPSTVQIYYLEGLDHTDMASQYTQSSQNESIESLLYWTADEGEYFSVHSLTDQAKAQLSHPAWSMFFVNMNEKGEYTTADAWGSSMALVSLDENSNVTIEPVAFDSVLTQHIQSGYSVAGVTASNAGADVEVMMYSSEGVMSIPVVEGIELSLEDTDVARWTDILPQSTPQDVTVSVNGYGMVATSVYQTFDDESGTYYFQWCSLDDVQSAMNNDSSIQSMNTVSFTQGQELNLDSLQSFHRGTLATVTSSDDQSSLVYLVSGDMQDPQGLDLSSSTVRGLVDSNFDQKPDTVLLEKNDSEIVTIVMLEDDVLQLDESSLSSSLYVPAIRSENISASDPFMIDIGITSDFKLAFDVAFITTLGDGGSVLSMDRLSEPQLSSSVAMNKLAPFREMSEEPGQMQGMVARDGMISSWYESGVLFREYAINPDSGATVTVFTEYRFPETTQQVFELGPDLVAVDQAGEVFLYSTQTELPSQFQLTDAASDAIQASSRVTVINNGVKNSYWLVEQESTGLAKILSVTDNTISLLNTDTIDTSNIVDIRSHDSPAVETSVLITLEENNLPKLIYDTYDPNISATFDEQMSASKIELDASLVPLMMSDQAAYLSDASGYIHQVSSSYDDPLTLTVMQDYQLESDLQRCFAIDIDQDNKDELIIAYGEEGGLHTIDFINPSVDSETEVTSLDVSGLMSDVFIQPWYQYDQPNMFLVVADTVVGSIAYISNFLTHQRMVDAIDPAWDGADTLSLQSIFQDDALDNAALNTLLLSAPANVLSDLLQEPLTLATIEGGFVNQHGFSLASNEGYNQLMDQIEVEGPLETFSNIFGLDPVQTYDALTSYFEGDVGF